MVHHGQEGRYFQSKPKGCREIFERTAHYKHIIEIKKKFASLPAAPSDCFQLHRCGKDHKNHEDDRQCGDEIFGIRLLDPIWFGIFWFIQINYFCSLTVLVHCISYPCYSHLIHLNIEFPVFLLANYLFYLFG